MDKLIIFIILCFLLGACKSSGKKENLKKATIELSSEEQKKKEVVTPSDSVVVCLELMNGQGTAKIHKEKEKPVYLEFDSHGYSKLDAQLSVVDSMANVRISQIIMPNGEMDGPFGRDIQYDLPIEGSYKLLIHESLMAGDPWGGDFTINVRLSK